MGNADQLTQMKQLLENQGALRQVLSSPDTKKVLTQLQKTNTKQLQAAAQAALQGDPSALSGILQTLSANPEAARAIEALDKKLNP